MVNGPVAGQHVSRAALDDPADGCLRKGSLQGHGRRNAMEHIADGRELDDNNRAGSIHAPQPIIKGIVNRLLGSTGQIDRRG